MPRRHQGSQQVIEDRELAGLKPDLDGRSTTKLLKAEKFLASIDETLKKLTKYSATLEFKDPAKKELARIIRALRKSRAALVRGDSQWFSYISIYREILGGGRVWSD